jgi:alpha-glucosidase
LTNWTLTFANLTTTITLDGQGRLTLAVDRAGLPVISPSRLGIQTAHADLSEGLAFEQITSEEIHDSYSTLIGKRREHEYVATGWKLSFTKGTDRLEVEVQLSEQGVAYRYHVPWTGPVTVTSETSEYVLPGASRAVLLPYDNGRSDYEELHLHTSVDAAEKMRYGYPALFKTGESWLLITESNLDASYAGSRLDFDGGSFRVDLPDPYVTSASPLVTPWRTAIIGDLATIVESDLITSLAAPSKVEDASWIKPGAAAWSWWSDGPSTRDLEAQKKWVDYAASQGWPHILADAGWNKEWMPELIAYAAARNVGVFLWSHWQHLDSEIEHREKLALWKEWGAAGVKIDFTESDGQDRMRWFDAILAATARLRMMVVFHGGTIPRGTERTWPQFLSAEAVKGAEWIKPKPGKLPFPAEHYVALTFTRNVQGPMDFTPVTFSAVRSISAGHELALAVLFDSGIQHFADDYAAYQQRPAAQRLLSIVPTVWDETRLLSGDPSDHVILARRSGDRWFIGVGVAGEARDVSVSLDFLPAGEWRAEAFTESPDDPHDDVVSTTYAVKASDNLRIEVVANGGFVVVLTK